MKLYVILTAVLCVVTLTFPFFTNTLAKKNDISLSTSQQTKKETTKEEVTQAEKTSTQEETIRVFKTATGKVSNVTLFDYIVGTVAGEMPASFSDEALKAQTVASFTYAKWIKENQNEAEKDDSDITDSSSAHQCYLDTAEQKEKWGENYEACRAKIEKAVESVFGEYLTYDGKTAMTVFHALSAGQTQSAEEIWGKSIPYLISVEAFTDEELSIKETELSFSAEEFKRLFEKSTEIKLAEGQIKKWAQVKEKTEGGYIKKLKVGTQIFTANEVKEILSLPGTAFKAKLENNNFIFTVYGKGHGVGMSQYSADYMARQKKSYKEILSHFYPGTILTKD